jgi:hypothetical protein
MDDNTMLMHPDCHDPVYHEVCILPNPHHRRRAARMETGPVFKEANVRYNNKKKNK